MYVTCCTCQLCCTWLQKPPAVVIHNKPPTVKPPIKNGNAVVDSSEDEIPESPVTPRRKKISVGMPIHPPEGELTSLKIPVNRRVEEVKGVFSKQGRS